MLNVYVSRDGGRAVVVVVAALVIVIVEHLAAAQAGHRARVGLLVQRVCEQELSPVH